jgi:hypothetical protein
MAAGSFSRAVRPRARNACGTLLTGSRTGSIVVLLVRASGALMYNVHMKRYSVAEVRQRLSAALDEADAGRVVVVERRGVRYRLVREPGPRPRKPRAGSIEILDQAVETGQWTWIPGAEGLEFRATSRRKRP